MLFNHLDKSKQSQRGSIMLEVIAVLALMGVMGAMLFRQIYQRNQELHNIQMASEMRTIKEAFSAYIQAERAVLIDYCKWDNETFKSGASTVVKNCNQPNVSGYIANHVKTYLPDGWFADSSGASTLHNYYTFSLWGTLQNDITSKKILYGVIVPKSETIPQTGWNFKRAARVALLIGADGGVYGSSITSHDIAGALGTWSLEMDADKMCDGNCPEPIYVAMTGMDIFTPEYELPEGEVNLKNDWDLATRKLGAWNYFSAGGTQGTGGCYVINHEGTETTGTPTVKNDSFNALSATCQPLFFVKDDGTEKKVFVNNDLEIGKIDGADPKANVTIRQEGPIAFNASVPDPQNSNANTGYLLDPQYTSVMNDVKIMSRGGAKLSEILPKYILQTQQSIDEDHKTVTIPTCPKSYKAALAVFPVSWDQTVTSEATISHSRTGGNLADFPISATSNLTVSGSVNKTDIEGGITAHSDGAHVTVDSGKTIGITASVSTSEVANKLKANLSTLTSTQTGTAITAGICVKISKDTTTTNGIHETGVNPTGSWDVILAHVNNDASCGSTFATDIKAIAQTYCVFDQTVAGMTPPAAGRKASMGADWTTFAAKIKTESECRSYGGTWNGTVCN